MRITFEIPDSRISDLLHGHGGTYSPWLHSLSGHVIKHGKFTAKWDREDDDEGNAKGKGSFSRADVRKGLALMAIGSPYQFGEFLNENDDDITFDTAMQYIIFGKVVYD